MRSLYYCRIARKIKLVEHFEKPSHLEKFLRAQANLAEILEFVSDSKFATKINDLDQVLSM